MNETIRDKWAEKLESGHYEQAAGTLRTGDAYCCLGILCEVFREMTGDGEWEPNAADGYTFVARGTRNSDHLPIAVREWAGLAACNPHIKPGDKDGSAAYLNDHMLDFAGIAQLVRQLPGV